ncbi:MAG: NUDIX hydrolase [Sandaracinus sp.]|nr:NUDIX hydrolase [Sandaracinus sp.]|tara:strand:- start:1070 stop:1915 length:846 start_codon:yes stop_codon:yes gene_type:complete
MGEKPQRPVAAPRDAATVLVLRPGSDAGFEIFMVRRHGKSGFMAGAHVFPGGKLDDEDASAALLDRCAGVSASEAAERLDEADGRRALALHVAAIRETFEEAGVLVADGCDAVELAEARAALHAGTFSFEQFVVDADLTLRVDRLVPQARWITPEIEPRRYDTRFFLAPAPRAQEASHDQIETTAGEWLTPAGALARMDAREIQLPPPTLRTLQLLAEASDMDDAFATAAARKPPVVQPGFFQDEGKMVLTMPGDPRHPVPERAWEGPTRFVLEDGVWRTY